VLLRKLIEREDVGTGPLPDLVGKAGAVHADSVEVVR
jgi:hypothetical protein